MSLFFDMLTKRDARSLYHWWNSQPGHRYEIRRSETNARFWSLWREAI